MSLSVSLHSALASLQATQSALQVASNNVANVNSEGYTRKTVSTQTQIIDGRASGVRLSDIERNVDENLLRQVRQQLAQTGQQAVLDTFFQRTQELFGSPGSDSDISHMLARVAEAVEALATSPENVSSRYDLVSVALQMTNQMETITGEIQEMRADADREISDTISSINVQLESIHDLNRQISRAVGQGLASADLKDVRDQALADLSELMEIQSFERSDGQVVVFTSSGRPLVDNGFVTLSHSAGAQYSANISYPATIDAITYGASGLDITSEFTGGKIAALVALRDSELVNLQAEFDRLAETTAGSLNAAHNAGTAYPPPSALTGTRSVAGTDTPFWSGTFRVTIADSNGEAVENLDINMAGITTVAQLATAINAMTNASASINANGKLEIVASTGNGIALSDLSSSVTHGSETLGVSEFLGMNDLLTGKTDYTISTSDRRPSATTALGVAGTLSVSSGGTTVGVAYLATDTLTDIATKINAAAGAQNVVATVMQDASGFRLTVADTDGDNVLLSDSSNLASTINLRSGQPGLSNQLSVRNDLRNNPALVASAHASTAATINVGDLVVSAGDNSALQAMAATLNQDQTLTAAGGLPTTSTRIADYAGQIIARNATLSSNAATELRIGSGYALALQTQASSLSEVNIDEEMAQIMILQNAYQASARLTTTISQMMDVLLSLGA